MRATREYNGRDNGCVCPGVAARLYTYRGRNTKLMEPIVFTWNKEISNFQFTTFDSKGQIAPF
jgi:hypothetical protein